MLKGVIVKLLGVISFFATIRGFTMIFDRQYGIAGPLLTIISAVLLVVFIKIDNNFRKSKSLLHKSKNYNSNSISNGLHMQLPNDELEWNEDDEDELYLDFESKYREEIHKRVNSFEKCRDHAYEESDLDKRIKLLKQTIVLYDEAKKWFYKTKGGKIYFDIWYEHLHNSRNDDFSYIDEIKDALEYYNWKKYYIVPTLLKTIEENKNILQRNIYQYLPDVQKSVIQQIIRELEQENAIKRTKKSNTYILELTDVNI